MKRVWRSGAVLGAVMVLLWVWEKRRPLRPTVEATLDRWGRNAVMAALGAVAVQISEQPAVHMACRQVERSGWGLLGRLPRQSWTRRLLSIVAMDYTLYWWHVLTHKVPVLWRFHEVHHLDRDMDFTTALRFHGGELLLSVPWRATQVLLLGIDSWTYSTWQFLLLVSILFHHSNVALPLNVERVLRWLVVTPRMHGLHHSICPRERESNWSSGLSLWDALHRTMRFDSAPVVVGLESTRVDLLALLSHPFSWAARPPD